MMESSGVVGIFDMECQNQRVSISDSKIQGQCQSEWDSGGRMVQMNMIDFYAKYRNMKPTLPSTVNDALMQLSTKRAQQESRQHG